MNKREALESLRYSKVKHQDIKSIEDIDKIVETEIILENQREEQFKKAVKTAEQLTGLSKAIIIIMSLIMLAVMGFLLFILLRESIEKYNKYGNLPNFFVLSKYLNSEHSMKEEDFYIKYPDVMGRNNSGEYVLTPKWNPELKFNLIVKSSNQARIEQPEYKWSLLKYYSEKYVKEEKPNFSIYKYVDNVDTDDNIEKEISIFSKEIADFLTYIRNNTESPFNNRYKYWPTLHLTNSSRKYTLTSSVEITLNSTLEEIQNELTFKFQQINNDEYKNFVVEDE